MDKETQILLRLTANHLYLAQFEALRATLIALRTQNPDLARAILQTIVSNSDRFNKITWSPSCSSPSLLTYLSATELLQYDDASSPWNFDPETLRLRADFVLLVQILIDRVLESTKKDASIETEGLMKQMDLSSKGEELKDVDSELYNCVRLLNGVLEIGMRRLRVDAVSSETPLLTSAVALVEENEFLVLRRVILDHADLFDAFCWNLRRQTKRLNNDDLDLAITLRSNEDSAVRLTEEEDVKFFGMIQRSVQVAHLDAMKEYVEKGEVEGAVPHLRFLHLNHGVEESEYRIVLEDLLKNLISKSKDYGDMWHSLCDSLLAIYGEALSSNCRNIVQMIQEIHDKLLLEEVEMYRAQSDDSMLPPLVRFRQYLLALKHNTDLDSKSSLFNEAVKCCKREMFHYARVCGLHVLECVVETTLSVVKNGELQDASDVLTLFPRLQPLVASMGWDLLAGKTTARRKLMQLLCTSKSQVIRLEESSHYSNKSDEISCVEHLCDTLCYHLDLAAFVACVNSGHSWNSKFSMTLSRKETVVVGNEDVQSDSFVENFVLERLSVHSPLRVRNDNICKHAKRNREITESLLDSAPKAAYHKTKGEEKFEEPVLFDVVPGIKLHEAIELISMQPMASTTEAWKRMQDVELVRMRYALESAVLALVTMEKSMINEKESHQQAALHHLKDLRTHLEAINYLPRKILMVNVIISLLHMDDLSPSLIGCPSSSILLESFDSCEETTTSENGNDMVISFTRLLLDTLLRNLPSSVIDSENALDVGINMHGRQALEWRISIAKHFIEEWEWRLSILQQLLPLSERLWRWNEALTVLRAAPSQLLNLCMQKARYDIGEEAVTRFSLSLEDKATLELAEWVDSAFRKKSVEDVVSSVEDLDFSSLRSRLGPLAAILLCIDVAATSARSSMMSQQLLNQAQIMLSEIYPGGSPRPGSTYWDQILEIGLVTVLRRILKRLHEFLDQDNSPSVQAILSGEMIILSAKESHRQGQRERALGMLNQMIEDAHRGKRQFLSGKLHNLARAIADEETELDITRGDAPYANRKVHFDVHKDVVLGLGLRVTTQVPLNSTGGESGMRSGGYDVKDIGKTLFGSLSIKPMTYLSQFILHIAAIGDIVDGTDTTHDFNFFSLIYEWTKDLLTRLVFERGSTDAAGKVAEIMSADFVHEVISASVPPVFPPRSGHGWGCIPLVPTFPKCGSDNKLLSHSSKEAKPSCYSRFSAKPEIPLYPLQLDVVKHLAKISPVRAVLACLFGSSILYSGSDSSVSNSLSDGLLQAPDADRLFYEFALDRSERFPTLNRWIQTQTNLHRVSEFAVTTSQTADDGNLESEGRASIKRIREHDSDVDSEADENVGTSTIPTTLRDLNRDGLDVSNLRQDSTKSESDKLDTSVFLSFDWDNEEPYVKAVERLIDEGKLMDALALADRFLRNGASDQLHQLLIERGEENHCISSQPLGFGGTVVWSNSWQYCLRLKDKQLAARLALKYMHRWELDAALDVLTMCSCHLSQNDLVRNEILQRRQALQRYSHILSADDHYTSWQEVEAECKEDPEGLALRLADKGAVSAALEVAESAGLSTELRRELQGRQLVKLLTADPLHGGGPAKASRFLSSLHDSDDALPVAMSAMQLLPNLRSKQLLVHFFLKRAEGNLSEVEVSRLNSWALGLRVLAILPLPWQQKCSSLHEHPHLILEVLLMRKQLQSAALILKEFPSLRYSNAITTYAAKAIAVSISSTQREYRVSVSGTRPKQKAKVAVTPKSSFSSSLSNLHKEARRAFSWAGKTVGDKTAPKDVYRKRKSSGLSPSERVTWEAMTGIQEDHISSFSAEGQERLPSVSIAEDWILTGDLVKDEGIRASHRYETAPDITLFKALLSMCSDESVSAKSALDLCINQMKNVLSSQHLPENASMEIIGRAYHATEAFAQGLLFAKSLLRKLSGGSDLSSNSEKNRDADDASSDAGSSSLGSQSTDELSETLSQADTWLARAELLQSLLGSGIAASLDDIADQDSSSHLRDRLIKEERYSMAVYTCKKCKIDVFPVWNAWGHALIRMEHYSQARVKFKQALQLYKKDPADVILEIINTMESAPPVDVSAVRSMYDHLAKSAPTILDDSLSADSYLNVLYMPSTFPRTERSRHFQESSNNNSSYGSEFEDGPRSNLDNTRYIECVTYLQEYDRSHLLEFMFRHGHYHDACVLFFPPNSVPTPPQPSAISDVTSSSSPQRLDSLATDYGTVDNLCDLCIGYGVMAVLEEVISIRMSTAEPQDEAVSMYTAAAVARICAYCETHRHFNYLCKFQVIKKDHVAAGLCCIQLFMNSSSQDEAIKHLEHAKMHFEDGLSARHKGGDIPKLLTRGNRGKSASEKLTEEGLVKFSARVSIQVEVVKSFNEEGPQWKHSLFGNPNDPETFRRRCKIAETLAEKNFDLAFQLIYEFNLPAEDIYAGVAASLAERKKGSQLTEFFRNIKGTINDDDWDQVLGAAINVYANKHKERPDRLIDMLTSSHRKVLACVVCGRLKSAFQIASRSGSVADVQYVAHQALHANALPVLDMCKQWLSQYM